MTSERNISIETEDGPMRAIIAEPEDPAALAVIMYPHVGGLTDTMRMMARRAAQGGCLCAVPELYHRLGTIVLDPQSTSSSAVDIRKIAAASLTLPGVMADTRALLDWLSSESRVAQGPRATIGYGRGGSFALAAAGTYPDEICAAASVLGFGFVDETPSSPHRSFGKAQAEFYCAFAEHDDIISPDVPLALGAALAAARVEYRIIVHPETRHPYAFPDRAVYDHGAAEADWREIFAMFARRLDGRRA